MKTMQFNNEEEALKLGYTADQIAQFENLRSVIKHWNNEIAKNPDLLEKAPKFDKKKLLEFNKYAQKIFAIQSQKYRL